MYVYLCMYCYKNSESVNIMFFYVVESLFFVVESLAICFVLVIKS